MLNNIMCCTVYTKQDSKTHNYIRQYQRSLKRQEPIFTNKDYHGPSFAPTLRLFVNMSYDYASWLFQLILNNNRFLCSKPVSLHQMSPPVCPVQPILKQ